MELHRTELKNILSGIQNPDMISYTSLTEVDMNKYLDYWLVNGEGKKSKNPNPTRNPYYDGGIVKYSKMYKVVTGFDYVKSVNRRRVKEEKEPDFVGGYQKLIPLKDINGNIVYRNLTDDDGITIIGREPIMVKRLPWFELISKGLVTDRTTRSKFYLRYQIQPDSEIGEPIYTFNNDPIMKDLFESFITQSNNFYDNQDLENPLIFLVCNLNNLQTISMGGEKYELIGSV